MHTRHILLPLTLFLAAMLAACSGDASSGEELFQRATLGPRAGCATCHSLEPDKVQIGPSLAGVASRAGQRVDGLSAADYIRQSILDPDAYVVEKFPAGSMPSDWGDILTAEETEQLVAFLLTLND